MHLSLIVWTMTDWYTELEVELIEEGRAALERAG